MKIILIMGLPGSGKTTLANELGQMLNAKRLNADEVRKAANDWDFSEEGRILGNKMVDMQLSNEKLLDRGTKMVMDSVGINRNEASRLLNKYKSVRNAIKNYKNEI